MSDMLSKDDFLKVKRNRKEVVIPFWDNKKVMIQELSFAQRNDVHERSTVITESGATAIEQAKNRKARVDATKFGVLTVLAGMINPDGTAMFNDSDYGTLASLPPELIDLLAEAIWSLSGSSFVAEKNLTGV